MRDRESAWLQLFRDRHPVVRRATPRLPGEQIDHVRGRSGRACGPATCPPAEHAVELKLIMPMDQRLLHRAVRADDDHRVPALTGDVSAADVIRAIGE